MVGSESRITAPADRPWTATHVACQEELSAWESHLFEHMGVSINGGTPIAGWFTMKNPIKMDDLGVPLFQETPI